MQLDIHKHPTKLTPKADPVRSYALWLIAKLMWRHHVVLDKLAPTILFQVALGISLAIGTVFVVATDGNHRTGHSILDVQNALVN